MKKILSFSLALIFSLSFALAASADEDIPSIPEIAPEASETVSSYFTYELDERATTPPEDESGDLIPNILITLFGEYHQRTRTVTLHLDDGSEITYQEPIPGLAGLDWEWIASVAIFALILFCIFKIIGGLIKL